MRLLVLAALLLAAAAARAITLVEPSADEFGTPLGTVQGDRTNALLGCWHSATDSQGKVVASGFLRPTSPAGGGHIRLPEYDRLTVGGAPYRVQAGCAGACGAGCFSPVYSWTIEWVVTGQ